MFLVTAKINLDLCFKTSISFIKIDFTTKGTQYFEMNAYHLLIMPINIKVDCTNIIKTGLQKRVLRSNLMRLDRIFEKIFFDNRCLKWHKKKRDKENDYRYIEILILELKTGSMLNGFDFCDVNLTLTVL